MKTSVVVLPKMKRSGSDASRIHAHHGVTDLSFIAGPDVHPAAVVYIHGGRATNGSDFRVLSATQCTMLPADRTTSLTLPATPYWRVEVQQPTETETEYTVIAIIDRDEQTQTPEQMRQPGPETRFYGGEPLDAWDGGHGSSKRYPARRGRTGVGAERPSEVSDSVSATAPRPGA